MGSARPPSEPKQLALFAKLEQLALPPCGDLRESVILLSVALSDPAHGEATLLALADFIRHAFQDGGAPDLRYWKPPAE